MRSLRFIAFTTRGGAVIYLNPWQVVQVGAVGEDLTYVRAACDTPDAEGNYHDLHVQGALATVLAQLAGHEA